ncbi:hypothetical protein H4W29_001104 [Rhizobium viscosum]|uniref:Uncharacterized protein n=1 Tax=Rhizobium viscosum TaxID=1673 RepID=A0ABR9IL74_RHIVS|nr:hypothetical protein [Rhizobium viscosum]
MTATIYCSQCKKSAVPVEFQTARTSLTGRHGKFIMPIKPARKE